MLLLKRTSTSVSRTYIAICYSADFQNIYFRQFTLPYSIVNTVESACYYFLNALTFATCIEDCFPAENFSNITSLSQ